MSRAIPILDLYREAVQGTDAKAVMCCANNYPFILGGGFGVDGIFDFNAAVQSKSERYKKELGFESVNGGLKVVEVSDDFLLPHHCTIADSMIKKGDLVRKIESEARRSGVFYVAMGTGATFSYAHPKAENQAIFDRTPSGQKLWLDYFTGWAKHAKSLGIQLYTGRRPGILGDKSTFTDMISLSDITDYVKSVSVIEMGDVNFGGLDLVTEITKSEALNLALALEMNRRCPGILQAVEQMQYQGMEPTTVEQVVRFNKFLRENLPYGLFVDMADNGHVGVRGSRLTNNPNNYDLFAYARAYRGPILFIHHNILFDNKKQPGTVENLNRDMEAKQRKISAKDMPYPERIRDINDYLLNCLENPNVKLTVVSPEPTCDLDTDFDRLAEDVAEATAITSTRILGTGKFESSKVLPFMFVTKGNVNQVDEFLRKHIQV
jgi:hypothetical protein